MKKTIITILGAIIIALGGGYSALQLGGVGIGSEYSYTQLSSTNASGTVLVLGHSGNSTLGSVTITEPATAGYFNVFNATSTTHSTSTAGLVAEFDSSNDVVGTYTFDSAVTSGIFFEVSDAFNGEYTVTWR